MSACAGAPQAPASNASELRAADLNGPPRLGELPELAPGSASARVEVALGLARQLFDARMPDAPPDHAYQVLQAWIDRSVTPWISARRDGVDEVRFQFGGDAEPSARERVVERALLGLLQEDTALELTHIPSPSELDNEPQVAAIFRDLVRTQMEPFRSAALREYRECARLAADGGAPLRSFLLLCRARGERLNQARAASSSVALSRSR